MSIEDQIIILTNTIAAIPPDAPPGSGYWLRRQLDELTRQMDGEASGTHAAARWFAKIRSHPERSAPRPHYSPLARMMEP